MSAAKPSLYEILTIESNDKERNADSRLGTISVDYYEDIFSPTITAKIRVVNTGDSIAIRSVMLMTLGFDHRLIDGAGGAKFIEKVRHNLETKDLSKIL